MFSQSHAIYAATEAQQPRDRRRSARRPSCDLLEARRLSGEASRDATVQPHQYTSDPTVAWEMLKNKRPVKRVIQMKPETAVRPDAVRFVCIACTHDHVPKSLPPGDVLIVAGDFTSCGLPKEVKTFNHWLGSQKHAYKIVIAGNHECTFDEQFLKTTNKSEAKELALRQALNASLAAAKLSSPRALLTHAIYLQDGLIELFGITIYGTPWQPRIDNWAFNLPRGQSLLDKWNQIPSGVDVLITHTPPLGYGCTSDGYTKFINCCMTDEVLDIVNEPVIFDIQVHPHTKQHYLNNVKKVMKRFMKREK